MHEFLSGLCILWHSFKCLLLCQHCSVLITGACNIVWNDMPPASFVLQIALAFGVFCDCMQILGWFAFFLWKKSATEILIGIAFNLHIAFGSMNILKVLILPVPDDKSMFPLSTFFFNVFPQCLLGCYDHCNLNLCPHLLRRNTWLVGCSNSIVPCILENQVSHSGRKEIQV